MTYISNTFNTTNTNVKYRIVVDVLSQDIINNRSQIRRRLQAWRTNTGFETFGAGNSYIRNDLGSSTSQVITSSQKITFNSNTVLYDDTVWVNHNPDGSRSLQLGGYFVINSVVSSSWNDFSILLPSIPRESTVTATNADIESATSININRFLSTYTTTLRFEFPADVGGALTGTIVTRTPNTSVGWTVPTSFYARIPNSMSGACKIYCDTFNGDTLVGTTSTTFVVTVGSANRPDVSAVITDTNTAMVTLTGNNQNFVRFISNAGFAITSTPRNSATIVSRSIVCGALSSTLASGTLNAVESGTFVVSTTDSRGLSNSVTITRTLINYVLLTINPVLTRNTPVDNRVRISYSGNYFDGGFGASANTLTVRYRFREYGTTTWSILHTLAAHTITGNTFSASNVLLAPGGVQTSFDYLRAWEFEVLAYDAVRTAGISRILIVAPGEPNHDYGKGYFNHNSPTYLKNTAGNLVNIVDLFMPVGKIEMTVTNTNPGTRFPGTTWVAWGTGRVPVGIDTGQTEFNTVEKTGGAKTHTLAITEIPSHTHNMQVNTNGASGGSDKMKVSNPGITNAAPDVSLGFTLGTGGGGAHNNLQPYITCYYWKRTA